MFKRNKKLVLAAAISSALAAPSAMATNGMNMEGYGAEATGMGGASMAYDNGTAATMNNPATLGLADEGSRLDVAIGLLQPNITTSAAAPSPAAGAPDADSDGDQYIMPALGWAKKVGKMSYGVGMFSQGGMGTDYDANSFLAMGSTFEGAPEGVRSEVGVGRLIAPLAYNVNSKLTVGGSVDFVWAGMDLRMALSGQDFGRMVAGFGDQATGTASGSMINGFGTAVGNAWLNPAAPVNWARIDFSDDSDFTGEAKSTGFGAKIGAVYKINNQFTIGGSYHSKTSLGDMETNDATMSMNVNADTGWLGGGANTGVYTAATFPLAGELSVNDFQWPEMLAIGMAYKINSKAMLAADYKLIKWSGVMDSFNVTFTADNVATNGIFAGTEVDIEMYQEWDDQNVIMIGGAYKVMPEMTLRAGVNIASNPVPDEFMNPLFPAIIEDHFTLGIGYAINPQSAIDVSLVIAPEVEVDIVDPATGAATGISTTHSQQNWQFVYSYRF